MNKNLYWFLYVIQRIINAPTLPVLIIPVATWAIYTGIYLVKRKGMDSMEAMLYVQQKSMKIMKSIFFEIHIGENTFRLSHIGLMFWIVLIWFML